jgi:nitrate reductase gamma subunit
MTSVVFAAIFYAATLVLIAGLGHRLWLYASTPVPLKVPTTPAPLTRAGAALRVAREVALFESLFRANKWLWLFGWVFHVALLVVLLRHLRYFIEPVPAPLAWIQPLGPLAGMAMVGGLLVLWGRRFSVRRVRYITGPSDHLMLALLIAIGLTGLAMKYLVRTDIVAVKAFFLGLMRLELHPLPADPVLLLHLGLVATLMLVFPFSKLLHGAALLFSPSRNQADDARERRYAPVARLRRS